MAPSVDGPVRPATVAAAPSARVPPYSEEAERGVLGSALQDAGRVIDLCLARGLGGEAFYLAPHRRLFEAMRGMVEEQRPVDLLTVGQRLQDLGDLEACGGREYLETLLDSTPTAAHAEYYIELVESKHLLRSIIDRSRAAIDACYAGEEDSREILNRAEEAILSVGERYAPEIPRWGDLVRGAMARIEHVLQNPGQLAGLSTGYRSLDAVLWGMQPSNMIILAARPSMGKTSLGMNIVEHVATGGNVATGQGDRTPHAVGVFSLEMSREDLVRRMVFSRARVPMQSLQNGYLSRKQHGDLAQAADALMKAPIYLDDTAGLSAPELRARARRMRKSADIRLLVVDYLQMLSYPALAREGRQREVSAISASLKAMAKELGIPVLVLSQLSRAPETRDKSAIPKLSDLRDSGSIEQDADVVCLLRRPCRNKHDPHFEDKTLAIVDVAKHRNGPVRQIDMNFEEEFTRFEDRAHGPVDADAFGEDSPGGFDE